MEESCAVQYMVLLPLSLHNLFCSLVLKRESRSQEYVWGFQYSLVGSKIHHLGQEKSNSLHGSTKVVNIHYLGQIQNLGRNKIMKDKAKIKSIFYSMQKSVLSSAAHIARKFKLTVQ